MQTPMCHGCEMFNAVFAAMKAKKLQLCESEDDIENLIMALQSDPGGTARRWLLEILLHMEENGMSRADDHPDDDETVTTVPDDEEEGDETP